MTRKGFLMPNRFRVDWQIIAFWLGYLGLVALAFAFVVFIAGALSCDSQGPEAANPKPGAFEYFDVAPQGRETELCGDPPPISAREFVTQWECFCGGTGSAGCSWWWHKKQE